MFRGVLGCLLLLSGMAHAKIPPPPGEGPAKVQTGFYLLDLTLVDERLESFTADIYLTFRWHDPRLAHEADQPVLLLADAASARLGEIWWPQLEFANTSRPEITNQSLKIHPDGAVELMMALTATYRAHLDLRRFPFDKQELTIRVESFQWTAEDLVFVVDPHRIGFEPKNTYEGLVVASVAADVGTHDFNGWGETFSEFRATIFVERRFQFYFWTVFGPVILIFLIASTIFLVEPENYGCRLEIALAGLLACIATQFSVSFSLPRIAYLTVIDRLFAITYLLTAVAVAISIVQVKILPTQPGRCRQLGSLAQIILPILYLVAVLVAILV